MIGRLVLSDRNIFKIKLGTKQVSARKCFILSESINGDVLVKTSKEFNPRDEYIKLDPKTNTILEGYGLVGDIKSDLGIYYHMFTLGWMSESKYSKLWDEYLFDEHNKLIDRDLINLNNSSRLERVLYTDQVITIDPPNSIDLDDGFSFRSDPNFYWLDIHIADPVSWFDLSNPICKNIFREIYTRQQSCYIGAPNLDWKSNKPTHLLPPKVVQIISLLELELDLNDNQTEQEKQEKQELKQNQVRTRRAISFCFKISKQTKSIEHFELKFTSLTNIKNYSYEQYDGKINNPEEIALKSELVNLSNDLIGIIGLNKGFVPVTTHSDISHKMIEIFMILTNWYGGNHLIDCIGWEKTVLRTQMASDVHDDEFDILTIPIWARPILSKSANYKFGEDTNIHYSLGISNYSHMSSPMRRFVDMLNHFGLYRIDPSVFVNFNPYDLEQINKTVKGQKKISNGYDLIKFIKTNEFGANTNKFKACLFDYTELPDKSSKKSMLVLYQEEYKFIRVVNVEMPQTELTARLSKYMEFDVELYYNSNNFKSQKFPFSIKLL
jgi:hypothetical protein